MEHNAFLVWRVLIRLWLTASHPKPDCLCIKSKIRQKDCCPCCLSTFRFAPSADVHSCKQACCFSVPRRKWGCLCILPFTALGKDAKTRQETEDDRARWCFREGFQGDGDELVIRNPLYIYLYLHTCVHREWRLHGTIGFSLCCWYRKIIQKFFCIFVFAGM